MDTYISFIKSCTEVPQEQVELFNKLVSEKKMKEGEDFIRQGQFSRNIGFVKEGLFRYYYTSEDGIEYTKGFFDKYSSLSSYSAILQNRASYFTIQAIEDSTIEVVSYDEFNKLFSLHPCWNEYLVTLLKKAYIVKEEREREFLLFDAEHRYKAFLERYPNIEKRVKQHLIASYLGIAPESLSRIRRKAGLLT